jgi:CBS domain-containing protein
MPTLSPERLSTPVRDFMRPGVITIAEHASLLDAKRAMTRHGVHAVLVVGEADGRPLGWVTDSGLLPWLERDLGAIQSSHAITEPAHYIEPASTAHDAVEALAAPGVSHLLVSPVAGGTPHGVVAPLDLVDLVTRPS